MQGDRSSPGISFAQSTHAASPSARSPASGLAHSPRLSLDLPVASCAILQIPAHVPSVVEMGLPALTDSAAPPAPALRSLLHAYLQTYSSLLHALTKPPPPLPQSQQQAEEWRVGIKEVQRLAEVGVNMIVRVNELRGEQVRHPSLFSLSLLRAGRPSDLRCSSSAFSSSGQGNTRGTVAGPDRPAQGGDACAENVRFRSPPSHQSSARWS